MMWMNLCCLWLSIMCDCDVNWFRLCDVDRSLLFVVVVIMWRCDVDWFRLKIDDNVKWILRWCDTIWLYDCLSGRICQSGRICIYNHHFMAYAFFALVADWLYLNHLDLGAYIFRHKYIYKIMIFVNLISFKLSCFVWFFYNITLHVLFDLIWKIDPLQITYYVRRISR